MARKSGFVRRHGTMRRETLWLGGSWNRTAIGADVAVLLTSLNAAALALRPFTVIRTRGIVLISSDVGDTAGEPYQVNYGRAIVSDQATAIGVTAVPTPDTDSGSDLWYVYEAIAQQGGFNTAVGFDFNAGIERIIDSKAMRRVDDGQDLISVVEGAGAATSEGSLVVTFARSLIKLH